ncbi:MAG TPA: alpha-amylase family glycosyl hydrolase, partial [Haliangium sp.]|nr:alpha-amylase family glycosyl hydrolase [Haliangium sp.]
TTARRAQAAPEEDVMSLRDPRKYRTQCHWPAGAVAAAMGAIALLGACAQGDDGDEGWLPGGIDKAATWYFRGTPNAWGTTAMTAVAGSTTQLETCQTFQNVTDPRFKIDRFGDWAESYPAQDYRVSNGSYRIVFDESTRAITATAVQSCSAPPPSDTWYFRGTPNAWGTTALTAVAGSTTQRETCQTFANVADPRFKIDRSGNWAESYPAQDYRVSNGSHRIVFDTSSKAITATAVQSCGTTPPPPPSDTWYFRGTPNAWAATAMTPVAGTTRHGITVSFARQDPSPRFKIDHRGDWTEAYPGQDVIVDDCFHYDIVFDSATKAITPTRGAAITAGACATQPPPPPPPPGTADFRGETIYFLLTARFYDGDPANNYYNRDRIEIGDPHWRGDFKGLIQKLDYIKDLGFTAIWITPPVENRSGLDYHGYHAYDWTRVDPRLESPDATYQDLIDAAHARGLKVIQDVVINHSSQYGIRGQVWIDHLPIKYYRPAGGAPIDNGPYQGNLGDYLNPFREDNDNPLAPAWFRARQTSDAQGIVPLVDPLTGATVPSPGYNPNRFFGIDAGRLDPAWYHLDGFMSGGDWESPTPLRRKHMAGDCIDLATENQNVKDYLNQAMFQYLDMGVDAIRLDTVKHIERNELLTYVDAWRAHAPDVFVFGENLVKGTGFGSELANDNAPAEIRPWWYTRRATNPANPNSGPDSGFSVLDFSLFSTFRDNLRNGHFGGIGGVLSMDWIYGDATKLVTFLQNHDVGPDNDFKYRFSGQTWQAAIAYNLLWTIRGIPTLYYGEEIEFMKGAPQDVDDATRKISTTGRAYFGTHLEPANIAATQSHPLYRHLQRLNLIRRSVPALQKGQMSQVNEFGSGMSFVRDHGNGQSYAVVGLATSSDLTFTVTGVRNGTYRDAVTGRVVQVGNGALSFTVRGHSAGIYVLDGPGKIGQDGTFLR